MKQRRARRPFARPTRRANAAAATAPVFQPLEPRKLLTTLYANPDLDLGQTSTFAGWVAMPGWFGGGMTLDASSVEDRSVRLVIQLIDSNPFSTASVTILDLAGHPLFPWIGQIDDGGGLTTDVTFSVDPGDDGLWGTDDDEEADVFGLDGGYQPGWRVATDEDGNFVPGVWIPDGLFHPVRKLEWLEDEEPPQWDFDNVPDQFTNVIPATGYWHPGEDGEYETDDDVRLPLGFGLIGAGTDDRLLGTADDAWVGMFASDPWAAPNTEQFEPHLVDRAHPGALADDGIADFNNGIGQIIFRNTLSTTRIVFYLVTDFDDPEVVRPFAELDSDRIGITMNIDGTVYQAPAMGSVIIGNPTNANWTVHDPINNLIGFLPPGYQRYDRETEGFRMEDPSLNETMGRVYVDGSLFGVSRFAGALERVHVGFFGGKMFVDGDFDTFLVAGDAGYYEQDGTPTDTRAALTVGRVLGSFVTGRNQSTFVVVQGDFSPDSIVDKPFLRADKVVIEHEIDIGPPPAGTEEDYSNSFASGGAMFILQSGEEDNVVYVRNDTLGTAQYAGRETGYSVVLGTLGGTSADDQHQIGDGGDDIDLYAVAADGNSTLRIRLLDLLGLDLNALITIQDADGNVLQSRGQGGVTGDIVYTPNTAGIIYIVIDNTGSLGPTPVGYQLIISNAAPVTLGEIRALGNLTYRVFDGSAITTLVGSIGTIRVGQDSEEDGTSDAAPFLGNVLIQSGDSIWNITSGGSIGADRSDGTWGSVGTVITAERHLGQLLAGYGRNLETGQGAEFVGGSIGGVVVNVRGDIGEIRARASGNPRDELAGDLGDIGGVQTGTDGVNVFFTDINAGGSIGVISADNRFLDDPRPNFGVRVQVGDGERIDLLEAGAFSANNRDLGLGVGTAGVVDGQSIIQTGLGGNVRFFRAPYVWGNGVDNNTLDITSGQSIELVDDSGAIFTVRVTGADSAASIVTHAIQGSVGVATVRIIATLGGSGTLQITNNAGNVEIGDVVVIGGEGSRVIFDGSGRTDVYFIRVAGGARLIENRTIGDIVAIDTDSVGSVLIRGNLGKTFSSTSVGPHFILGPIYNLATGLAGGGVGAPLVFPPEFGSNGDTYLAGGPFDQWLNGLAVRDLGTNVGLVRVDGTIIDVYSEVTLTRVTTNADNETPFGEFHGIEGSVYSAGNIARIDLGDGLVDTGSGPFVTGLIAAVGTVQRVNIQGEGHNIYGIIMGRGFNLTNVDGIGVINATQGASIIGALITTNHLDSFFDNPLDAANDSGGQPTADINRVTVIDGHIINSTISAVNINQVNIKGGRWDSNRLTALGSLNTVRADEYIFSYADVAGAQNLIVVAENVIRIETQGRRGDIHDLTVDIIGNLNFLRGNTLMDLSIDVDESIRQIDARARIVRSFFRAGAVTTFNAMEDITRVTFNVAGPVNQFRSRNSSITRIDFTIDGPDGRLNIFEARTDITGDIRVSGEVKRLRARDGDIIANIEGFSGDGYIRQIQSGRDMVLTVDVDLNIDKMIVGRNLSGVGSEAIKVRGDFGTLDLRNGTFDGTIIVEGAITKTFTIGAFADGSEIVSRRSINTLNIDSGVNGAIVSYTDGIRRLDIDGDFAGSIAARNGSLDNVTITGNAAGTIHADEGIRALSIRAAAGLGGGSGNLTGAVTSDTTIDRIDIDGDVSGARILTLFELRSATVRGNVTNSIIGAGERVTRVDIDGNADSSFIIAGLDSLGDDNALGGAANNADTFSSGNVDAVNIGGTINNLVIAAGVRSGSDGYATPDATTDLAPGLSNVNNIRVDGAASGTNRIIADTTIGTVFVDGTQRTPGNPGANMVLIELDQAPLDNGGTEFTEAAPVVFTDSDGDQITLSMRGPGTGMYLLSSGGNGNLTGLVFNGTASNTNVDIKVTAATGNGLVDLNNVHVQFSDDADLGNLTIEGHLDGSDAVTIDGTANTLTARTVNTSGTIAVGGEARRIVVDGVTAGAFVVTRFTTLDVLTGGFGGRIFSETIGTVNVRNGVLSGVIWGRDSIGTINNNSSGAVMDRASISTRGEIQAINAATIRNVTLISAGDVLRNVNLSGDLIESELLAGLSLGSDGRYEGTGAAADVLSAGVVESVRIQGSFDRSAIAAGVTRGVDRFYGTGDDIGSLGFGVVRRVEIMGAARGSNFNSQTFGFTASGIVEQVRVNREDFVQQGNVVRTKVNSTPLPLTVLSVRTRIEADTTFIDIFFNEDVDISTILLDPNNPQAESAIFFENPIDPNGVVPEPNDAYTIFWNKDERMVSIRFQRSFSLANPGVYTLVIDGTDIRSVSGINLDANHDGVTGDDYRQNFLIGDAGDRVEANTWDPDGDPNTPNNVDFMAATRLDLILDDLVNGTGIKNRQVSFVSRIGDHPDTESFFFPQKFDVDVYQISLDAGDILRVTLSEIVRGSAFVGSVSLRSDTGAILVGQDTLAEGFIERTGGTYYLTVAGTRLNPPAPPAGLDELIDISNSEGVFTPPPLVRAINPDEVSNDIGAYELNVMIFDDDDTGFVLATPTEILDGQPMTVEGFMGFDSNGVPFELFGDVDVFDISRITLADQTVTSQLEEGMNLTVTLRLSGVGGNLGGRYEVGVFQTTQTTGIIDGLLMGAPGPFNEFGFTDGVTDITFNFQIPEAGTYAVMIQGNIRSNYELIVTVDTGTQGDRLAAPYEQNILIETNGGFAEWFGKEGTELGGFGLASIGFSGFEDRILSQMIDEIVQDYADAGITVNVSIDPADFVGEEFTTVFLTNQVESGLYGIASTLDPQNQSKSDEAIVFVPTFASLFAPGQVDELASALADVVSHEVAHTLGLRHAVFPDPFSPPGMMDTSSGPNVDHIFQGDPNDPWGTASILTDSWFFGLENEVHLLQLIFDVDA